MAENDVEIAARDLAAANAQSDATISKIYWFPAPDQIRLIEVDEESIFMPDEEILPVYFGAIPSVPYPSGIALIHPDEDQNRALPTRWNTDWSEARVIFERKAG